MIPQYPDENLTPLFQEKLAGIEVSIVRHISLCAFRHIEISYPQFPVLSRPAPFWRRVYCASCFQTCCPLGDTCSINLISLSEVAVS